MKIIFRTHKHTKDEIQLGHKLGFTTLKDVDAISATANINGFTPLSAVIRCLGYDVDQLSKIIESCRKNGKIELIVGDRPSLIIVPPTRGFVGKNRSTEFFITQMLQTCNSNDVKRLHFTHFGFINSEFPRTEISRIFLILLNPLIQSSIEVLYFEIDSRYIEEVVNCYLYFSNYFYQNNINETEVITAPEFEYVDFLKNSDGSTWREFVLKT